LQIFLLWAEVAQVEAQVAGKVVEVEVPAE
jgi:hypothetical protein